MAQIRVHHLRSLLQKYYAEEISFSYMVQELNEIAAKEKEEAFSVQNMECDICKKQLVAVHPATAEQLECPNCTIMNFI